MADFNPIAAFMQARWLAVWRHNLMVWVKLAAPAIIANLGEPMLYLLGFGYGLEKFVGTVGDMSYLAFLASGIVCSSAMNTASLEGMYSAYSRMAEQHTWQAILATPLDIGDIVIGEVLWAATKSLISVIAILPIAALLGAVSGWQALWVLPLTLLTGICFGAIALVMTALARNFDFFLYFSTLVITPMLLFSGVFFPLQALPEAVQLAVRLLPLSHAVELARPLMTGGPLENIWTHLLVILAYSLTALYAATKLLQRRLQQ